MDYICIFLSEINMKLLLLNLTKDHQYMIFDIEVV